VESIDRGEKNTKLKKKEGEKLHVGASLDTLQMSTLKKEKTSTQALLGVDRSHKGKRLVLAFHDFSAHQGAPYHDEKVLRHSLTL
jgi:hypothetical protein